MAENTSVLMRGDIIEGIIKNALLPYTTLVDDPAEAHRAIERKDRAKELKIRISALVAMLSAEPPCVSPTVANTLREYPHMLSDSLFQRLLIQIMESHAKRGRCLVDMVLFILEMPDIFQIRKQVLANAMIQTCLQENLRTLHEHNQDIAGTISQFFGVRSDQGNPITPVYVQ